MARDTGLEDIHVEIDHPKMTIEGYLMNNLETDEENREKYIFFLGVPYARPPLGDLRFQPPEQYVYDPVKDGNPFKAMGGTKKAPQVTELFPDVPNEQKKKKKKKKKKKRKKENKVKLLSTEDCLYLNIYVPKRPKEIFEPLAVMVYFHGGGFFQGNSNYSERTPESMMRQNILLVMVNYRLGPFGFLNLHTDKCKGNAGMKDQVMALKWVQKNIRNFGGDPNNVTICGESAGGSCVNFHLVSPLSRGLFHKAIVQSGGIYCPWGYTGDQRRVMNNYKRYNNLLKGKQKVLIEKLMEAKAEDILCFDYRMGFLSTPPGSSTVHLGPSIESFITESFIPYGVQELMKDANPVPILAGITALDGYSIFLDGEPLDLLKEWILNDENFCDFLGANLHWERAVIEKYFRELRHEYFDMDEIRELLRIKEARASKSKKGRLFQTKVKKKLSDSEAEEAVLQAEAEDKRLLQVEESMSNFCTDLWFHRFYDNFKLGCGLKKEAPKYIYEFNFVSDLNLSNDFLRKMTSAAHGDDLVYLFCPAEDRQRAMPFGEDIQKKITTMCSLWASFCKTGVPTSASHDIEWLPHTEEEPKYLYIGEDLVMKNGRLKESRWETLKAVVEDEERIKAQKSHPSTWNTPASFRTTLEDLKKIISSEVSPEVTSESSAESKTPSPEISNPSEHMEETKEGECSQPSTSCPKTFDFSERSKGGEGSNLVRLEVPTTDSSKRHSPSKSPTSQSKTSKDEASQAKKERTE